MWALVNKNEVSNLIAKLTQHNIWEIEPVAVNN